MSKQLIPVSRLGKTSRDLLTESFQAEVSGITSRGLFLPLDSGWILFISCERFCGPLTLNLVGERFLLDGIEDKARIVIEGVKFRLPPAVLSWISPVQKPGMHHPNLVLGSLLVIAKGF